MSDLPDIVQKIDATLEALDAMERNAMERNAARYDPFGPEPLPAPSVQCDTSPWVHFADVVESPPRCRACENHFRKLNDRGFCTHCSTRAAAVEVPRCRGCRRPAHERPVERDALCCFCLAAPRCENTRDYDGRRLSCIRPSGHTGSCDDYPDGPLWIAQDEPDVPLVPKASGGIADRNDPRR